MKAPSVSILFDKRNMTEGRYSVKYAVYFDGKQKHFASGLVLEEKEVQFLKANKESLSGRIKDDELRNLWNRVYGIEYRDQLTGELKEGILQYGKRCLARVAAYFTFEIFSQTLAGKFNPENKAPTDSDMIKALEARGHSLMKDGDGSNGSLHLSAASSLRRYAVFAKLAKSAESANLPIMIVTADFLRKYEKWMLKFGKSSQKENVSGTPASITTASIYGRYIRKIWNDAIETGTVSRDHYPFKTVTKSGFKLATVLNKKKALPEEVISKLFAYSAKSGSSREKWLDMWLFIYMGNGLNTMDLCHLENNDLDLESGQISFFRDKTIDTKRNDMSKIIIHLLPELIEIIEKWRNPDRSPRARLFPFLPVETSPERIRSVVNQVTRNINDHMTRISKELDLGIKIKTYEARHTFATVLAAANAPLKLISEKYGHGSLKTTERYIASIENRTTENYLSNIVPKKVDAEK